MKKVATIKILLLLIPFIAFAAADRTIKTEIITTSKSNQNITITPTGSGDVVLKAYTGFLNWTSGVPTEQATISLTGDVSGVLPVSNGGTNSSTALNNNFVMISSGGAIVEDSAISTTELSYLDNVTSNIQTQLNTKLSTVDLTSDVTGVLPIANGGTGSATQNFVDLTAAQTVAGVKTFSSDSLWSGTGQIDLPVGTTAERSGTPNSGMIRFNSDTASFEGYDGSAWGEIGGGGAGGINYLTGTNTDAEVGVGDWSTYADAAGENPVDGTGGTASLTFSQVASATLRETGHFQIAKAAVNEQGEGVSIDFTIDNADKAKKLIISFDYNSETGYADDDLRISIYDVTNANLIRVNGEDLKAGDGTHYAQFQTASDSTSYRLIFHVSSTSATAYNYNFDNVKVGPQVINHGTIVTNWESFTPTITHTTNTTITSAYKRRVGDSEEYDIYITYTGTPDAVNLEVTGLNVDLTKTSGGASVGTARLVQAGIGIVGGLAVLTGTGTIVATYPSFDSTFTDNRQNTLDHNWRGVGTPVAVSNGDQVRLRFTIPVSGFSANAKISEDFSGRDIIVEGSGSSGGAVTANVTNIEFTETLDTTASWNGTQFTVPETGDYHIDGQAIATTTQTGWSLQLYVDGSVVVNAGYIASGQSNLFRISKRFTKGEVISFRSTTSYTQSAAATNRIHIRRYQSAQTTLENELVAASYQTNAGQGLTSVAETIVYEDLLYDTHNAYNTTTGVFTAPISGKYRVSANYIFAAGTWNINEVSTLYISVDSLTKVYDICRFMAYTSFNEYAYCGGSLTISLNKGQTLEIGQGGSYSGTKNLLTDAGWNNFSIERIK